MAVAVEKVEPENKAEPQSAGKAETEKKAADDDSRRGVKRKLDQEEPFVVKENEPEIGPEVTCLDWFNSDLNLIINKETFASAEPFTKDGWGYVWAGARATFGFSNGKIW